ncbi:MAG: tRNA (adenosine(37)-N6)-threonylcarbamoyltransferase complex ATPase subunit type 1 TsaE [Clostridia bacterium]|nr:tRNA (adenosine(37)-N6)-threonylcarbamoyltransferase complex ATPase subunit type 1 TsaE [Clostridia bacterium]
MNTVITNSAAETRELGKRLAEKLKAGDVILLEGDLGAGKSEFARGVAKGLGVTETVTSPSFTILNVYESGKLPLYHFDWYRLESSEELYELGMDEYLGGNGIALVEWPAQCPDAVPEEYLRIRITATGENSRQIETEPYGGFRMITLE